MYYILLIIIILLLLKNRKGSGHRGKRRFYGKKNKQEQEWKSEWKFNPETELWEHPNSKPQTVIAKPAEEAKEEIDYAHAYQSKLILTKNEWYEYKKLKEYAVEKNLYICPKVRLLDIIEPRRGDTYLPALGKVKSKHVDFVITDPDLRIKAILELDDSSHDKEDRIERDKFVDTILTSVGYRVIHTRSITKETLNGIQ